MVYPTNERRERRGMKRTNIYLTEIQHKKFKVIAKEKGIFLAELIRRVLDDWLEKHDAKKGK